MGGKKKKKLLIQSLLSGQAQGRMLNVLVVCCGRQVWAAQWRGCAASCRHTGKLGGSR